MQQINLSDFIQKKRQKKALEAFYEGYHAQMKKRYAKAIEMYQESIRIKPTAEAYTFLGWTYSFLGELDAAIEECKNAIDIDPDFGNPYNDIGAYMIAKGDFEGAEPYLDRALASKRYKAIHFAHYNLGRVYEHRQQYLQAYRHYKTAVQSEPRYLLAQHGLDRVKSSLVIRQAS